MVQYRTSDTVIIQVRGPKSYMPQGSVTERANLGMTWLHFLNTICGLRLDTSSTSRVFICTTAYTTLSPESGWTADLNDPIRNFIEKFQRKRNLYNVRLHTGGNDQESSSPNGPAAHRKDANGTSTRTQSEPANPWVPSILRKSRNNGAPVRKFATVVPLTSSQVFKELQQQQVPLPSAFSRPRPTPAIDIPSQGSQGQSSSLNQIRPPQQPNRLSLPLKLPAPRTYSNVARKSTPSSSQTIPETTLQAGQPRAITSGSSKVGGKEPSPPKLQRFDAIACNGSRDSGRQHPSKSHGQPGRGPSFEVRSNTQQGQRHNDSNDSSRSEEDTFPGIMTLMGGALKIEPVEVDLVDDYDDDDQEAQQLTVDPLEPTEEDAHRSLGIESFQQDAAVDNASVCTAADLELRELAQLGIPFREIKGETEQRLERFDNSMLNRCRNEYLKLRSRGQWERNIKRCPLAFYLLAELFKD